ncbi:hypothetical protein L218DRAFT_1072973 [Marasmius fiardii PR-910]|nr:hypothetical protein L218DRAFT_1072973 [Marasmius fiardii PR-910]
MLRRSIDQAIHEASLSNSHAEITVSTLFPIYIRIAGFDDFCPEAIVAFEHAMDKAPIQVQVAVNVRSKSTEGVSGRPIKEEFQGTKTKAMRSVQSVITKLREEYWLNKLGGCKDKERVCQCSECGGMKLTKQERYVVMKEKEIINLSSGIGMGEGPESQGASGDGEGGKSKTKKLKKTKTKRVTSKRLRPSSSQVAD